MDAERPLQLAGAVNAYCALLAERAGFRALYLSGAGVANAPFGLPDLAVTTLTDVTEDLRRITGATNLPVLVDADTGWGNALMIVRVVRELTRAGAAGCQIEDQVQAKRCGHRPGKALVPPQEMEDRIRAAADGCIDNHFVIVARTDALAVEGLDAALHRAHAYAAAGADVIRGGGHFARRVPGLRGRFRVPVLANLTEFGKTPLFSVDELRDAGVPGHLPAVRLRHECSGSEIYQTIRREGTQSRYSIPCRHVEG
jgi:methylisocitrate lyase